MLLFSYHRFGLFFSFIHSAFLCPKLHKKHYFTLNKALITLRLTQLLGLKIDISAMDLGKNALAYVKGYSQANSTTCEWPI